uniref:Uncharacterized protein n=1 Tax=Palpitomonas bilix TaxID=652834 RepID=A0A7S3G247_9EUKA|mmetsp:Transcript_19209/g.49206  ORF Transcript_19209/g.49206 Transcript_19209/m.49206 type:complete len:119 (+) Transcript_19209:214-570(+)|eukprot:CAMPEP_0113899190 /NCGR_PEP_ID=MMETSP0780_2-20120614/19858_1 /TAXON_ID=652834 /ORGANISM="Palpitomonas bilix" /LENGTH=118 /DNA_ID=CAMNT_0000891259 /DNA_START=111 /DNA_END=467 /DNA_ORIENTATION=- /assembly_acc=CAM_ASM_000599
MSSRQQSSGAPKSFYSTNERPPWNGRNDITKNFIPAYDPQQDKHCTYSSTTAATTSPLAKNGHLTTTKAPTVAADWTLLCNEKDSHRRRQWPEYNPETAASVGRRWVGANLSKLHEYH